jgi:ribonuclease HI
VENLEQKLPFTAAPWWQPAEIVINENAEQATKAHDTILLEQTEAKMIYTDGSGINNKIGAAAVAPELGIIKQAFMGEESMSTVYSAELEGIHMALKIAQGLDHSQTIIFSDSQGALKAIWNPGRPSGQYILTQIVERLDQLQQSGKRVGLHWIPAHQGIEGNEKADTAAKEATGWRRVRSKNGKWKEVDTGMTADKPQGLKQL